MTSAIEQGGEIVVIDRFALIAYAALFGRAESFRPGKALLFIVGIKLFANSPREGIPGAITRLLAAVIGGYRWL